MRQHWLGHTLLTHCRVDWVSDRVSKQGLRVILGSGFCFEKGGGCGTFHFQLCERESYRSQRVCGVEKGAVQFSFYLQHHRGSGCTHKARLNTIGLCINKSTP